jgi:hypothetical protein
MRNFFFGLLFICTCTVQAQDPLGVWTAHIPHGTVSDLVKVNNRVFCATEIGLFIFDESTLEVTTYSKLNGLNDIGIQALAYDRKRGQLLIGYKNGNIDIFDGENITNVNDIFRSPKYVGKKRVNHIKVHEDVAFISTGFGIVELDLDDFVVLNTLIIGDNAKELEIYEVDVDVASEEIYAATEEGVRVADMNQPLIFFSFWNQIPELGTKVYTEVDVFGQYVFVNQLTEGVDDSVFYKDGAVWKHFTQQPQAKKTDIRVNGNTLIIIDTYLAVSYNSDLNEVIKLSEGAGFQPGSFKPNVGWPEDNGNLLYIGHFTNGLLRSKDVFNNYWVQPDGPFRNSVYTLSNKNNVTYVAPGSIDEIWNRRYQFDGIFQYKDFNWTHITEESLNFPGDIVSITQDPRNSNKIWANAWGTGILEIENGQLVNQWDNITTNGALTGVSNESDIRTGGLTFDESGTLWATNSLSQTPLIKRDKEGNWIAYSL